MAFAGWDALRNYANAGLDSAVACPACLAAQSTATNDAMATAAEPPPAPVPAAPTPEPSSPAPQAPPTGDGATQEEPDEKRPWFPSLLESSNLPALIGVLAGSGAACWFAGHYIRPGSLVIVGAMLLLAALALTLLSIRRRMNLGEGPSRPPPPAASSTLSARLLFHRVEGDAVVVEPDVAPARGPGALTADAAGSARAAVLDHEAPRPQA